jgi:hypothetical protein
VIGFRGTSCDTLFRCWHLGHFSEMRMFSRCGL